MRTRRLGISDSFLRIFKFKELRHATMDFSNENFIGRGYADVFKGWINSSSSTAENSGFSLLRKRINKGSGTDVAVAIKRTGFLSRKGSQQFEAEVNLRGSILHPNVIKLLGYCREKKIILVYEFMHKGTLRNCLVPRAGYHPLSWDVRMKIAVGIARGLAFLHTLHIIHRCIKMDNILVDSNFNAKLTDFKLPTNSAIEREYIFQTKNETVEYLAPEYAANGHISEKIDVYGFGVVLLEIICGKQVTEILRIGKILEDVPTASRQNSGYTGRTNENSDVLCMALLNYESFVSSCISDYRKLTSLIDPALHGRYPMRGACLAAQLARSCVASDPECRPSMQEVIESLEYIQTIGMSPTEEVDDPCPFLHDINSSFSTTVEAYESAPFDADAELSSSKLRAAVLP